MLNANCLLSGSIFNSKFQEGRALDDSGSPMNSHLAQLLAQCRYSEDVLVILNHP